MGIKFYLKQDISKYEIKELFLSLGFDVPTSISEQTRTDFLVMYIVVSGGQKYKLKISYSDSIKQDAIMREVFALQTLEDAKLKLHEEIVHFDVSHEKIDASFLILKVNGIPYKKKLVPMSSRMKIMFALGQNLARVHNITGVGFGFDQLGIEHSWDIAYKTMLDELISLVHLKDVRLDTNRIYNVYFKHKKSLEKARPVLVHFNLRKGNVLIDSTGKELVGLAGWQDSMWGDSSVDFVNLNPIRGTMRNNSFIAGYKSLRNLDSNESFEVRRIFAKLYLGIKALVFPIIKWRSGKAVYIYKPQEGREMIRQALRYLENISAIK